MASATTNTDTVPDERDEPSTPVVRAGRALHMSRTTVYKAIGNGTFPLRVIKAGSQLLVSTRELRELLGLPVAPYDGDAA
jgi:hypothetical protein